jgi:hypothetical protein
VYTQWLEESLKVLWARAEHGYRGTDAQGKSERTRFSEWTEKHHSLEGKMLAGERSREGAQGVEFREPWQGGSVSNLAREGEENIYYVRRPIKLFIANVWLFNKKMIV